ncbi:PREDICTED: uncharacterized protein LOC106814587 [Priapulus caudatus]|uniref:Uncharacterized protein LOC106814587 n=1 Tax=Priapulus caudatus TaxID=37621 RepID=A0ABM1EQE4_PRICU|nr:PREDICTED: uncharacterized protein LOC106814587 [Priapulus caudatus]
MAELIVVVSFPVLHGLAPVLHRDEETSLAKDLFEAPGTAHVSFSRSQVRARSELGQSQVRARSEPGQSQVRARSELAINMIGSLLVYCLAYYPIFACLSMKSVLGYLTGCVYVWTFLGAELVWIFWPYKELHRYNLYATRYALLQLLPSLLFLILLSLMMPVKAWKMWHERKRSKDQVVLQEFYQAEHVRRLLQKPEPYARCKRVTADSLGEKLRDLLTSVIYSKVPGFRYSPRILASVVVWAQFIYIVR